MRIGIITHPLLYNYGGILQNYALQQVLIESGHEVNTIDKVSNTSIKTKIVSLGKRSLLKITGRKVKLRGWQTKYESAVINKNTRGFVKKYISTTGVITNNDEVDVLFKKHNFDAFIVGSDQVWRRSAVRGNHLEFLAFLEGNNNVKKIAYSASFGVSEWEYNEAETIKYSKLAQLFHSISVREDEGIQLCKTYLNVNAQHLIDPTMLLSKDKYVSLVESSNVDKSKGKLFSYVLDRNDKKKKIIKTISEELSLESFEVMPEQNYKFEISHGFDINKCVYPKIEQWLKAFIDAEFVITDSFHGAAFAIIFNKPFIAIVNEKRGASRFYSLLRTFGLENRSINQEESISPFLINEEIDFLKVNTILKEEIKKSMSFLNEALNG
jgi:hypothetical protein